MAEPNTREDLWESFWSSSWGLCRASQDTWNFTSCLYLGTLCNPQIPVTSKKCTYTVCVTSDKTQNDLENISHPYPIKQNDSVFSGNIMALVWHYQTIRVFQSNSDGHITLQFTEVYFILPLFFMLSFFLVIMMHSTFSSSAWYIIASLNNKAAGSQLGPQPWLHQLVHGSNTFPNSSEATK